VNDLGRQLLSDPLVTGDAKRAHRSQQKRLNGAGVGLMTGCTAIAGGWVERAAGRWRLRDIVTVSTKGAHRCRQQCGYLGGVNQMTSVALSRFERHVLGERLGGLQQPVVAGSAELLSCGVEKHVGPGVGIVAGDAAALYYRLMEHG
jgi:hypothetical protein